MPLYQTDAPVIGPVTYASDYQVVKAMLKGIGVVILPDDAAQTLTLSVTGGEGGIPTFSAAASMIITAGQAICFASDGRIALAVADAPGTAAVIGLATISAVADGPATFIADGPLTLSDWAGFSDAATLHPGARYYLSATRPGAITAAAPTAAGQLVVPIGVAVDASTLALALGPPFAL